MLAAATVAVALAAPAVPATSAGSRGHGGDHWTAPASDVLTPRDAKAYAKAKLTDPGPLGTEKVKVPAGDPIDPIDQRILVIATTGDPNPDGIHTVPGGAWDWNLSTLTSALDYVGMPYDTYKTSTGQLCHNGSWAIDWAVDETSSSCTTGTTNVTEWPVLTPDRLWKASDAYYSGVMLTSSYLPELDFEEWSNLWTFEATFGIRMVSAFTFPAADYGMSNLSGYGENVEGDFEWTAAGAAAFPYVTSTLPVYGAPGFGNYGYYAGIDDSLGVSATPILTSQRGVVGVIATYPDQGSRETLALTFDSARYFTHGQVLGFGLVNWVTKGQFIGFRKATLDPQIDDMFVEDQLWSLNGEIPPCGTWIEDPRLDVYRLTGADLLATVAWQSAKQGVAISKALKLSMPFNGEGTETGYGEGLLPDPTPTLVKVARSNQKQFKWINHSYDHPNLDGISYADSVTTIQLNNEVAKKLRFSTYDTRNFVQPDISGLQNPDFLAAAYDTGLRFLISDTSRTGNPGVNGPNEGLHNVVDGRLFEVPRYPTNMYFNVSTPEQWLAEDNCLYPAGAFGHIDTYDQLLDREATNIVRYLLQGDNRPIMFHEANLRAYDGTHSVFSDLIDRALQKYGALVTVPVTSPTMDQSAALMQARMQYNDALRNGDLSISVVPGTSMTLSSNKDVTVPITGFNVRTKGLAKESYAGQTITYVPVAAGVPRTIIIR